MTDTPFDAAYYRRFYENASTRAVSRREQIRQARLIGAYLRYLDLPIASVLDVGCGLGRLLQALGREFPDATCRGVEISDYLCERLGWTRGSVVDFAGPGASLVVCSDVCGYLNKRDCRRAVHNLAALTHGALYFSVLTEEDMDICDTNVTDMRQRVRPARFYRDLLDPHFVAVGAGLFLRRPLTCAVWQLERTDVGLSDD